AGEHRGGGAAEDAPGPAARLPRAVLAGPADRVGGAVLLPHAQPDHADLGALRDLACRRYGDLFRLRPAPRTPRPRGAGRVLSGTAPRPRGPGARARPRGSGAP